MSAVPPSERRRFAAEWMDYVLGLNEGMSKREAHSLYASERDALLARFRDGPLPVFRMIVVPAGSDATAFVGTTQDLGRYWTTDAGVARQWVPGGEYGGVAIPDNGMRFMMTAMMDAPDCIDMVETIACRLGSSWEQEIRVPKGACLTVVAVETLGPIATPRPGR